MDSSRRPSANRFRPITKEAMAKEGHNAAQGLPASMNSRPLATMLPQSGGGRRQAKAQKAQGPHGKNGVPNPEHGINYDWTPRIGAGSQQTFMYQGFSPRVSAALIYSLVRMSRVRLRTNRAIPGVPHKW